MENSCRQTILACYIGYIVQAIVNNFVPLLFVMFERTYQIPLAKITLLITINFCIQLAVDLLSAWFLDRIGYRAAILLSHIASAAGLVLLTILPDVLPDAFTGLLIAVTVYAIGGGLLEVIVSPVMESCPTQNKEQHMSLLHSFYCCQRLFSRSSGLDTGSFLHCCGRLFRSQTQFSSQAHRSIQSMLRESRRFHCTHSSKVVCSGFSC